jgi:hypothetical protein
MTTSYALIFIIAVSLLLSAAVTLFYLLPLSITLMLGLPNLSQIDWIDIAELARRSLLHSSFALIVLLVGAGLRLSLIANQARNRF